MTMAFDDTIVALATAPGAAGLAVFRVSGAEALSIADAVFEGARALSAAPTHTLHHGWVVWPRTEGGNGASGGRIDEVVAAVFRAPRSYTREDVVEVSCHGGEQTTRRVFEALRTAGARPARPGEFTLRAFLNGRIDLAQAEAVADLVHASTERARSLAMSQLAGALSRQLRGIAEQVADAAAEVEARVDFAEDVGGVEVPSRLRETITALAQELAGWLEGAAYARAVREGAKVPIVGRPNVGKSSLFNALLGEPRAIVAPLPGTTRDRVSESLELHGIRVALSDTAGWRETEDPIEAMGVALTDAAIGAGALVLWVVDGSEALRDGDRAIAARLLGARTLVVMNKSDLPAVTRVEELERLLPGARVVRASAARDEGIGEVTEALADLLGVASGVARESAVGNPRHVEALTRAREALERASFEGARGAPGEIVALELRESLAAIGEVLGTAVGEDLLERIFSRFCIGK
jgi:tRNA modification GTPase